MLLIVWQQQSKVKRVHVDIANRMPKIRPQKNCWLLQLPFEQEQGTNLPKIIATTFSGVATMQLKYVS